MSKIKSMKIIARQAKTRVKTGFWEEYQESIEDRMEKVKILDDDAILPKNNNDINFSKHKRQLFGMFSGDTEKVYIEMHESLIDVVFDTFGDKVKLRRLPDGFVRFSQEVQVSPVFYGWCCSFGQNLRVTSPKSVVEGLRDHTKSIYEMYK